MKDQLDLYDSFELRVNLQLSQKLIKEKESQEVLYPVSLRSVLFIITHSCRTCYRLFQRKAIAPCLPLEKTLIIETVIYQRFWYSLFMPNFKEPLVHILWPAEIPTYQVGILGL